MTKRNPEVVKVCVVCEKQFSTSISRKQTCSPECNTILEEVQIVIVY
jgi:predicted nucleic acid-binding Zn ribbon protein